MGKSFGKYLAYEKDELMEDLGGTTIQNGSHKANPLFADMLVESLLHC